MKILSVSSDSIGKSLAQALEYVSAWKGKTVVVKFGGSVLDAKGLGTVPEDLVLLQRAGVRPVLVHGGGPEITRMLDRIGKKSEFINGLRVTDAETMEIVEMVLAGRINKHFVGLIHHIGGRAVGLSGKDGALLQARRYLPETGLGYVGEVARVDARVVETLLADGFIPIVSSVGLGDEGTSYNLNADTAAAALAAAMKADKLIVLTDVEGVYREHEGRRELVSELSRSQASLLITDKVVTKGMVPKVEACLTAIDGGVASAHIISGETPHGLLIELFTETGIGTMIRPDAARGV